MGNTNGDNDDDKNDDGDGAANVPSNVEDNVDGSKDLLLCTLDHVRTLNRALSIQRLERMLSVYRAWVAVPASVEGGFALTRNELECVLEFPEDPRCVAFLFETFKTPRQRVDLITLLVAAALVCHGPFEERAKLVFTLVDLDTEDDIVEAELALVISACANGLARLGVVDTTLLERDALALASEAFAFVAIDDDDGCGGKMSFAAFVRWCIFHERPRALFDRICFLLSMSNTIALMHDALTQQQTTPCDPLERYNATHAAIDDSALAAVAVVVGPIIGRVTPTSVTFLLEVNHDALAEVFAFQLGDASATEDDAASLSSTHNVVTTFRLQAHEPCSIIIDGLAPGTTYTLRLLGVSRCDREACNAVITTPTASASVNDIDVAMPSEWTIRAMNHSRADTTTTTTAATKLTAFEQAMYARAAHAGYASNPVEGYTPLISLHWSALCIPHATTHAMLQLLSRDPDDAETRATVSSMLTQSYRSLLCRRELALLLQCQANVLLDDSDDVLFGDARDVVRQDDVSSSDSSSAVQLLSRLAYPVWQRYVGCLWSPDDEDVGVLQAIEAGDTLVLLARSSHTARHDDEAMSQALATMLDKHPTAERLVLVTRSPIVSLPSHRLQQSKIQPTEAVVTNTQQLLMQLVAWKRSALTRSVVLLSQTKGYGCASTLRVKDTTITIRQCVCGSLSGVVSTLAPPLNERSSDDKQPAIATAIAQLDQLTVRHGDLDRSAHIAVVHTEHNATQRNTTMSATLEPLHAPRTVNVLVGPVVGHVSSTTAHILLECDAEYDAMCVLLDRITGERVVTTQRTLCCLPVVFDVQHLRAGRLYDVEIHGLAAPCRAIVQTPYADPMPSWTLLVVADDTMLDARVSSSGPLAIATAPQHRSLMRDIVERVLPTASGLQVDATLHLGATVALAHDLANAYNLFARLPVSTICASDTQRSDPEALCTKLVRQCVRCHWCLPMNQQLLARGAHIFTSVGVLRSLLTGASTSDGIPLRFLTLVQRVLHEYEAVGRAPRAFATSSFIQQLSSNAALLTLDTLDNIVKLPPYGNDADDTDDNSSNCDSSDQFAQLQTMLLSTAQWQVIEAVLSSNSTSLELLVLVCDIPLVWQGADSDARSVFGNAWSLYPTERRKLLDLLFAKMQQSPAFHATFVCCGPFARRTTIRDVQTQRTLEQLVVGPVSTAAATIDKQALLVQDSELLDGCYSYTHALPSAGASPDAASYAVLDLVPHSSGSSSAAHVVVSQQPATRILVGPVVGRVTPRSARILIELDQAVATCVCVLTNTVSKQRLTAAMCVEARSPTLFKVDALHPNSRYAISFEGILLPLQHTRVLGYIQTPSTVVMAFEWLVVQHHVMANYASDDDGADQDDAALADRPSSSSWSQLVQRSMRAFTAQACAATSDANGDTLGESVDIDCARFNPWFAIEDTFLSEPMTSPQLVVHLGGQVDMQCAFTDDELLALVHQLGGTSNSSSSSSGASPASSVPPPLLLAYVRDRIQDVYRLAWGVPPLQRMLGFASNVMLLNEKLDLFFSTARLRAVAQTQAAIDRDRNAALPVYTDAAIAATATLLRATAFEYWQRYQNQLWVDVNERDVVPNAVKNSTKFAFTTTLGVCRIVMLNVSHDVHELRSTTVRAPRQAIANTTTAKPRRHAASIVQNIVATSAASAPMTGNDADAELISLFTDATWKTLDDALLPPASAPAAQQSTTATLPAIQQVVVVVAADVVAWAKAFPQLRPDIVRLFDKCFAWQRGGRDRRVAVVCSSDYGSSITLDVTDEKRGETLSLSCIGSISERRAIGNLSPDSSVGVGAAASTKKTVQTVKGHFSKRYTYHSTQSLVGDASLQRKASAVDSSTKTSVMSTPTTLSRTFASYQFVSDFTSGALHEQLHYFPPKAAPRATLGPVLGRIAFQRATTVTTAAVATESTGDCDDANTAVDPSTPTATALILLEINANARVTCVVTDSLANRDIRVVDDLERDCPHVFAIPGLEPERRYIYRFEGISNAATRRGCFHTPQASAQSMHIVALSANFPDHLEPTESTTAASVSHEATNANLWAALLERVQLPWCSIDAVLHCGGQVPLQEAAIECVAWLERELQTPTRRRSSRVAGNDDVDAAATTVAALRRRVRKRCQQHYLVQWNLPHVRDVFASVSNWFLPTRADVAPFERNHRKQLTTAEQLVLDVVQQVVADYQLALMQHDALDESIVAPAAVEAPVASPLQLDDRVEPEASNESTTVSTVAAAATLASTPPVLEMPELAAAPADVAAPLVVPAFIEQNAIGFFFCDMRDGATATVDDAAAVPPITCNGRLTTPLKVHEHPIMSESQWLRLESALKRKRVLLFVLCMEFPLVLTNTEAVTHNQQQQQQHTDDRSVIHDNDARLYDSQLLAQHWVGCPRQLEQLLALLFRWKAKRRGRDVLVLSGGVRIGLDTLVQEATATSAADTAATAATRVLTLRNLTCGPITARVEPFALPLSGIACPVTTAGGSSSRDAKSYTFVHRPIATRNYVLAELQVAPDPLANASLSSDNDDAPVLAASVEATFVDAVEDLQAVVTTALNKRKRQRFPSWWPQYIPMGRAVFYDDAVTLTTESDATMVELRQFINTDRSLSAALDVLYEKHGFADAARLDELRSTAAHRSVRDSSSSKTRRFDRSVQFRAVLRELWRALPGAKRQLIASLSDPFVVDFCLAHVAPMLVRSGNRMHDDGADAPPIELAQFRTLCRDVVVDASVLHLAVRTQRSDAVRAAAAAVEDAAKRVAQDALDRAQQAADAAREQQRRSELLQTDPKQYARELLAEDAAKHATLAAAKQAKQARKQAERVRELDEERWIQKEQAALNRLATTDPLEYERRQQLLVMRTRRLQETRAQRAAEKAHKQQQQQQHKQ